MHPNDFRFDLIIEPTDYGHISRLRSSPAGQAVAPFDLSVTRRQLNELQRALQRASHSDAFELNWLREELQSWGQRLFAATFHGDVLNAYRLSKKMADDAGNELRIQIDLTEMEELGELPWEYLFDSDRQEFVGLSAGTLLSRYSGMSQRLLPPTRNAALRVLVVIPSPISYPSIDVQREWLRLVDSVDQLARDGKLIVEWLQKPTLFDLQKHLRDGDYHILHFMGYGSMDPETGSGQLLFEDEVGRTRAIGGTHLGHMLRDHFSMRLVILTGQAAPSTADQFSSGFLDVAQQLIKRGVGAVLSTPYSLPVEQLSRFIARFYAETGELRSVDRAVAHARSSLRDDAIWWGAPVLNMRVYDGNLFSHTADGADRLSEIAEDNIAFRLSALRIQTASPETMARWSEEPPESRLKRRIERD